jgi:flavin reductase (DIM6/NTAB) family NADH-FMN oxidoreductase RutF
MDREQLHTICFFPGYKKELGYLGTRSGRDEDKVAATGLTPVFADGYTYFAEAKLVLVCEKIYQAPLKEEYFLDKALMEKHYPERDFHDLYVGRIVKVLAAE